MRAENNISRSFFGAGGGGCSTKQLATVLDLDLDFSVKLYVDSAYFVYVCIYYLGHDGGSVPSVSRRKKKHKRGIRDDSRIHKKIENIIFFKVVDI